MNTAAEQLRLQWERVREDRAKDRESAAPGLPAQADERPLRRSSAVPTRPPLEERATLPIATTSRFVRYPTYDETPSKIPMATRPASPAPIDRLPTAAQATPLRRAATKSLGNLQAAYLADATPAKQTIPQGKQRTSIGSPSELQYNFCEDISMASPAPSSIASPAPFVPRPRRSSIAPAIMLAHQGLIPKSATSADLTSSPDQQENIAPFILPPTMIPAPTTYVYREAATPAKWTQDDPDLPSPFIRRASTAPATVAAIIPERQPLGSLSLQQATAGAPTSTFASAGQGIKSKPLIPRSRSGNLNLHQHVLRANAHARTSGEGVRARPAAPGSAAQARMAA